MRAKGGMHPVARESRVRDLPALLPPFSSGEELELASPEPESFDDERRPVKLVATVPTMPTVAATMGDVDSPMRTPMNAPHAIPLNKGIVGPVSRGDTAPAAWKCQIAPPRPFARKSKAASARSTLPDPVPASASDRRRIPDRRESYYSN